jgi:hypothetical protein
LNGSTTEFKTLWSVFSVREASEMRWKNDRNTCAFEVIRILYALTSVAKIASFNPNALVLTLVFLSRVNNMASKFKTMNKSMVRLPDISVKIPKMIAKQILSDALMTFLLLAM